MMKPNDITDALADALACEEHLQGMPLGQLGHCKACDEEAVRKARAEERRAYAALVAICPHDEWIDISTLGDLPGTRRICATCGALAAAVASI